jgi:hypothetical protein
MDNDVTLLICGYCDLEDILKITKERNEFRDKVLKLCPRELPLMKKAMKLNHYETIIYLLELGKDYEDNLFTYAIKENQLEILKFLEPDIKTLFKSLIYSAISYNRMNILKYLLSFAVDIEEIDPWKFDPAYYNARLEMCECLWDLGYKPKENIINQLCTNKHLEILKFLQSKGYTFNEYHMELAILDGACDIIQYFVSLKLNLCNNTCLRYAIEVENMKIIKLLGKHNKYQYEHFQIALYYKNLKAIDYLASKHVKPKEYDYQLIQELRDNRTTP